jgi:hypothetical protein
MPENAQVRTDSDRRQFLQMALSESVEQPGGNFNKAIRDLANAGKLNVRAGVYRCRQSQFNLRTRVPIQHGTEQLGACSALLYR